MPNTFYEELGHEDDIDVVISTTKGLFDQKHDIRRMRVQRGEINTADMFGIYC